MGQEPHRRERAGLLRAEKGSRHASDLLGQLPEAVGELFQGFQGRGLGELFPNPGVLRQGLAKGLQGLERLWGGLVRDSQVQLEEMDFPGQLPFQTLAQVVQAGSKLTDLLLAGEQLLELLKEARGGLPSGIFGIKGLQLL